MDMFKKRARLRAILVSAGLAAALALPIGVSADTTGGSSITPAASIRATIAIGSPVHVMSRVLATVDVSFTCDPIPVYDWETDTTMLTMNGYVQYGTVVIAQASGRSIASGSVEFYGGDVLCNGTTVYTRSVPVVASTIPWKSGAAVIGATISITDANMNGSDYASSGAIAVKLTR